MWRPSREIWWQEQELESETPGAEIKSFMKKMEKKVVTPWKVFIVTG